MPKFRDYSTLRPFESSAAHIEAYYKDGKFYDLSTNKEVHIDLVKYQNIQALPVIIQVPLHYLNSQSSSNQAHAQTTKQLFLDAGTELVFSTIISILGKHRTEVIVSVILKEALYIKRTGNKEWQMCPCACEVTSIYEKATRSRISIPTIEANSLNQAFTLFSQQYRPHITSHTCNSFKTYFRESDGMQLDLLRD